MYAENVAISRKHKSNSCGNRARRKSKNTHTYIHAHVKRCKGCAVRCCIRLRERKWHSNLGMTHALCAFGEKLRKTTNKQNVIYISINS